MGGVGGRAWARAESARAGFVALQAYISHAAHIGGTACGLACSFIFLPEISAPRVRTVVLVLSVACMSFFLIVLPCVVYLRREAFMRCQAL